MNLKQTLKKHRISQRKLAQAIGYSPAVINQIINHGKYPQTADVTEVQDKINQALVGLGATAIDWAQIPLNPPLQKGEDCTPLSKRGAGGDLNNNNEMELPKVDEKNRLTAEAQKQFSLPETFFIEDVQSRDDVYLSGEQRYIRQSMLAAAKHGGFMAIVGESGAGKTTLKDDLVESIRQDKEKIIIITAESFVKNDKGLTVSGLCDAIIDDVSHGLAKPKRGMEAKSRQIKRLLTDSANAGYRHCLIIDEAQDLTVPMLKYLKRFWELKDGYRRLLGIVLVGQPELQQKLGSGSRDLREVARRCEQVELQPLNAYVGEYLKHKLNRVGLVFDDIFADDAMTGLTALLSREDGKQRISYLYPLIVNNAVISAMNACAELGLSQISADIFEGV